MMVASRSRRFRPTLDQLPWRLAPSDVCPMDPVLPPINTPPPPDVDPMDPVLVPAIIPPGFGPGGFVTDPYQL
jgi:hypothetical protein